MTKNAPLLNIKFLALVTIILLKKKVIPKNVSFDRKRTSPTEQGLPKKHREEKTVLLPRNSLVKREPKLIRRNPRFNYFTSSYILIIFSLPIFLNSIFRETTGLHAGNIGWNVSIITVYIIQCHH